MGSTGANAFIGVREDVPVSLSQATPLCSAGETGNLTAPGPVQGPLAFSGVFRDSGRASDCIGKEGKTANTGVTVAP